MAKIDRNNQLFRGFSQSNDGVIKEVLNYGKKTITFLTCFGLSEELIERLKHQPEHFIFSERSRIARLGVQISCEPPNSSHLDEDMVTLKLTASAAIPGYPSLKEIKPFFTTGLPVGRLVFCDPEALLTADEVLTAIERSELKLPASTTISSDGRILIKPHSVICRIEEKLDKDTLGRILFPEDGRDLLNRYQKSIQVPSLIIPPEQGIISTCSMYLNDHYVVLQSGSDTTLETGRHLPATILDPIKTRGIRIYLEIVNNSKQPIVNPLIPAKVYSSPKIESLRRPVSVERRAKPYAYDELQRLAKRFKDVKPSKCHAVDRPLAVIKKIKKGLQNAELYINGPEKTCRITKSECALARFDFSARSVCPHIYATSHIQLKSRDKPAAVVIKYFPNALEHHDIINLAGNGLIEALYFFDPSHKHGPFLSQRDHGRLQEYSAFGLKVYWISGLKNGLMVHTMRDGKGYFVLPERLADFHKSMLFAFYGSNKILSDEGVKRLSGLMDALVSFWGKNIGVVTGGGSGVMEHVNTMARERRILSGANFLDITDQSMTTDVDFCQVFQSSCRHSRQKWFEVASFPIFNIGGLGSLEELGITLCNMKLSILEPVPIILFDTDKTGYWQGMEKQIHEMVHRGRAPEWILNNIIITSDPREVITAYSQRLHLF